MPTMMKGKAGLDPERRSRLLWAGETGSGPVVYWMSREQRCRDNWGLIFAQHKALAMRRPLVVVFCLTTAYPGASSRQYGFLLRGLAEVWRDLCSLNIAFTLLQGDPLETLPLFVTDLKPALLVMDFDPLRIKQQWRTRLLQQAQTTVYEVDGHNIVPCWIASQKREYGAYTLRPKLKKLLPAFLTDFPELRVHPYSSYLLGASSFPDIEKILVDVHRPEIAEVQWISPGEQAAGRRLAEFVEQRLQHYRDWRNNPNLNGQSGLSPYLHFGQLAPQRAALEVSRSSVEPENKEAFLEELIVRRELADNYCWHTPEYDCVSAFPEWAQRTLDAHRLDLREWMLDRDDLDKGNTPEALWNGCQRELREHGRLHGYLRMYWAKKILEWSRTPEEALASAIYLNDRYALDGRDPNGYAGIAWSIGGVHDRPWAERPVFGMIRYMNERGCRRKFDVDAYLQSLQEGAVHSAVAVR